MIYIIQKKKVLEKKITSWLYKIEIKREQKPSLMVKPNLKRQQKEIAGFLLNFRGNLWLQFWGKIE